MAGDRRLRGLKYRPGFQTTLDHHKISANTAQAKALARLIGRLRATERLPLDGDLLVEFWGAQSCWARRFASPLWLYYQSEPADEHVVLLAVYDYLHEQ